MMDAATSSKRSEAQQQRLLVRRRDMRRYIIILTSFIVLVGVVVVVVIGTHVSSKVDVDPNTSPLMSLAATIKAVCNVTLYKHSCYDSLMSSRPKTGQPDELFRLSLLVSLDELNKTSQQLQLGGVVWGYWNATMTKLALQNCGELLGMAMDQVKDSIVLVPSALSHYMSTVNDLKTWLSAATTYHDTCLDGFEFSSEDSRLKVSEMLKHSTELTSNSLALANWFSSTIKYPRRLLTHEAPEWWAGVVVRRLMSSSKLTKINANITVAKDGEGMYRNISAALKAVPDKSNATFIIYVKKGVYAENVRVEKSKWNVIMIGDGANMTVVTGSLNVVDGTPTFSSATLAVFGKGFMARDMGFYNTAGAMKRQAVALMSTADKSAFYRCGIDGFQNTLYAHSNRQFYRSCDIYGTVDVIIGNSAVVLQNCNILLKAPIPGQQNTITAQGKSDPNMNTGTSVQNCTVSPHGNLTDDVRSYLGRPWKDFSTTIFMSSYLSNIIHPDGWSPWVGTTAPDTIFYAEYMNKGPGAVAENRVNWTGLHLKVTEKVASGFTVRGLLQGDEWIPSEVPRSAGL
uniref:pectinesterase n=1 Tax=Kalanchoe fedtschenkoi TaxID=63787 RepID=A0A7N0VGY5_KALFE